MDDQRLQAVHAQLERKKHDRRPVPAYVSSGCTVSGNVIGNAYDGRWNRSRLVEPAHMATAGYVRWEPAREAVWFPSAQDDALARGPPALHEM